LTKDLPFCATQSMGARENQEDSYGIIYDGVLTQEGFPTCFILADGMGGHKGGAIASQIAIDSIKIQLSELENLDPLFLAGMVETANQEIAKFLELNPTSSGMGTTLIVALIKNGRLYWASVGDSALFLARDKKDLVRVNDDHSMRPVLEKMIEAGLQSSNDYDALKNKKNMLRSALMGSNLELVDTNSEGIPLEPDDSVILCSDGFETLEDLEIYSLVQNSTFSNLSDKCLALTEALESAKNPKQDNSTLILIDAAPYLNPQ
jgi:PPM family protein phosphatase